MSHDPARPRSEALAAARPGLFLLHKPVGATSFSLVQAARELLDAGDARLPVCHGGALDPFAHGLLPLLVGPATRLMERLHDAPKVYEAQLALGRETDTGDAFGATVLAGDPASVTPERLRAALQEQLGEREQVPPAYSNKRVGGERAHLRARRGEVVTLAPARVYLHAVELLDHTPPFSARIRLSCRGGFYVRALAQEVGRALGCGAHLSGLWRSAIGPWQDPGPTQGRVPAALAGEPIHGAALLPWLPTRELGSAELKRLAAGLTVRPEPLGEPAWPLPEGFISARPAVLGLKRGRIVAVLERSGEGGLMAAVSLGPFA